jgi:hypothetical protein
MYEYKAPPAKFFSSVYKPEAPDPVSLELAARNEFIAELQHAYAMIRRAYDKAIVSGDVGKIKEAVDDGLKLYNDLLLASGKAPRSLEERYAIATYLDDLQRWLSITAKKYGGTPPPKLPRPKPKPLKPCCCCCCCDCEEKATEGEASETDESGEHKAHRRTGSKKHLKDA